MSKNRSSLRLIVIGLAITAVVSGLVLTATASGLTDTLGVTAEVRSLLNSSPVPNNDIIYRTRSKRHIAVPDFLSYGNPSVSSLGFSAFFAQVGWNNTGTDYNSIGSWTGGVVASGNNVAFFGSAATTQPNLSSSVSISGLDFSTTSSSGYDVTNTNSSSFTFTGQTTGTTETTNSNSAAIFAANTSGTNTIDLPFTLAPASGTTSSFNQAGGGTLVVNGISSGSGITLNLPGAGIVQLNGNNGHSGGTTVNSGTLQIGNAGALGAGSLTLGSSTATIIQATGGSKTITNNVVWGGNGTLSGSNAFSFNGTFTSSGAASRSITVNNAGGLVLGGNVFLAESDIARGLTIAGTSAVAVNGVITNNAAANTVASPFTYNGSNILTLSNANTFTGNLAISGGGTVSLSSIGNSGSVAGAGAGTQIDLGNATTAGTLIYNGTGETTSKSINLKGTTGGATIDQSGASGLLKFTSVVITPGAGAKTLTLQGSTGGTGEIAGAINDNSPGNPTSLTKTGTGTWTLSGSNTYTGSTIVNTGTLLINGLTAPESTLTVGNTATVGGIGTILGPLVVANGGTVAPGLSPGILNVGNAGTPSSATFNGGSNYAVQLGGTTVGSQYDQLNVTGTTALNGTLNVSFVNSFTPAAGNTFTVVASTGAISGTFSSVVWPAGYTGTVTYNAHSVVLSNITLIPPTVNLSVSSNTGTEAAQTAIVVTATASAPVTGDQTVALAVTGTNITAGDYTLTPTTITILSGQTTGTATFTVVDDNLVEGTETAVITESSPSAGITLGATTSQNIAITDNDFPKYRSVTTGNWNANSTWEQSTDGGTTWVAATGFPSLNSTSGTVTIRSGDTVTLGVNEHIDEVTVASGGTLIINNISIDVPDGPGTDVSVDGTILFQGSGRLSGLGSFSLNAGGTIGINDVNGITASAGTGSVFTTTRSFSPAASYIYTGTANQVAGDGLPSSVANLTINNSGSSSTNTVTGNVGQTVTGLLRVQQGKYKGAGTFGSVQVDASCQLTTIGLASQNLFVSGNWTVNGQFSSNGGIVNFVGVNNTQTIATAGVSPFNNLTVNHSGTGTVDASNGLTVNGIARVSNGRFNVPTNSTFSNVIIDSTGNLAPLAGASLTVTGGWSNIGTFTPGTSTVNFDGGTTQSVLGDNTFYNLASTATSDALTFEAGKTQTVTNSLTWVGDTGAAVRLVLRSTITGTPWKLHAPAARNISFVDVKDSDATGSASIINPANSLDAGNNTNWFPPPAITTSVSSLTDFGSVTVGNVSAQQNYTVSGSNLTANVVVTAPADFQVSLTSGTGFGSSVSIPFGSGTLTNVPVYVRYAPTSAGATGSLNITNTSTGAATQNVTVSGTGVAPICTAPPSGIVAWYPAEGNANDIVGGNNGTLQNGATASTAGKVGNAFSFDGITNNVSIPTMNIGNAYTVETWIKPAAAPSSGYMILLGNTYASTNFGTWYLRPDLSLEYWNNGASQLQTGPNAVQVGQWAHIALTRKASDGFIRIYVNGALVGATSASVASPFNNSVLLGYQNVISADVHYQGLMDEVSFYNRDLSAAELLAIYNQSTAGKCTPPPPVNLSVSSNTGTEAGQTAIIVTATASTPVSGNQTVNLAVTGTGITSGDYTLSPTTITILSGQTTGTATFTVVDDAVFEGTETATITESSPSAGITLGATTSQNIVITDNDPGPAVSLTVVPSSFTQTAGTASSVTVTAKDILGNTATGYTGTIQFGSTDGQATLPGSYTFVPADAGVKTFSNGVTLKTAGVRTITATDSVTASITGTTSGITVSPAATSTFTVAAASPQSAGVAFNFTVTAKDAFGNVTPAYVGTAAFSSTDLSAVLPSNYTFGVGDAGSHSFSATLNTGGGQTITATDTITSSITGTSGNIVVTGGGLVVNDLGNGDDATAGDGICETSGGNGICTLRAAIEEVNATAASGNVNITFQPGLTGTITVSGSALPYLFHNMSIVGPGADKITVNGGGIDTVFNAPGSSPIRTRNISGLTITGGNAGASSTVAGGIQDDGDSTISGCVITANSGLNTGGIHHFTGTMNLVNSTVSNNTASLYSGGVQNDNGGTSIITNTTISGNTANNTSNSVWSSGGIVSFSGPTSIINSTIANNLTNGSGQLSGGATNVVGFTATLTIKNTLIAGNQNNSTLSDLAGAVTSGGNNLIGNGSASSGVTNGVNGDQVGANGAAIDPLLATLGNYGGTTPTHALLPGSPAINAGTNCVLTGCSGASPTVTTDQRGTARPKQSTVDIGAFESQGFTLAISSGNNQSATVNSAFSAPLAVTVTNSFGEPVNGGAVVFTAPGSGASASIAGNPATISGGAATSGTVTANATAGAYNVAAGTNGASAVNFSLTNLRSVTSVVSISRTLPNATNASNVTWQVTFADAVDGLTSGNFNLVNSGLGGTPSIGGVSAVGATPTATWNVTASTGTGNGTLGLNLVNDTGLTYSVGSLPVTGQVYTIDRTPPTVSSIVRAGTNPTNAASVQYTVTFSEAVSGVDTSDFALTTTGVGGTSVASVTGGPTVYTATVNTGSGDGSIRLDAADNDSISDTAGNALGGTGAGNGNFTTGEVYTIDKTAPTVTSSVRAGVSPTNAASVQFTVTFSEAVSGVDTGDFALTTSGVSGASVSNVAGGPTVYTVTVNTGSGDGTIRLDVADDDSITDGAGNKLGGTGTGNGNFTAGQAYTIDKTPPTVTSSVRAGANPTNTASVQFTVTFSEAVSGVDTTDFALTAGGVSGASVTNVTGGPTSYTVTVNTGSGDGTIRLDVADNDTIIDSTGNALGGTGAGNGNFTAGQFYTIDKTAPDTVIDTQPPTNSNGTTATFTFHGTDAGSGVASFECKLDTGAFAACTSPQSYSSLTSGPHTFQVRAIDAVGNVDASPASYSWTVDTTAPDTTILTNPAANTSSTSATFTFSGSDPGGSGVASFQCQLDGGGFSSCTTPKAYTGLAEGPHSFQVRAIDNAGNTDASAATYSWLVDTTAPDTSITAHPTNPTTSTSATFTFSGTDSGAGGGISSRPETVPTGSGVGGFECKLDTGAFASCTSPNTYTGLADGSHTFQVRAIDNAGNVDATPASFTWVVDTTAPDTAIVTNPAANSNSTSAAFTFTGNDGSGTGVSSFDCKLDGGAFAPCTSPQNYTALGQGSHTFQVRAIDAVGNFDASPAIFTWTVDTTPPTVTINQAAGQADPTSSGPIQFTVTFSEAVTGFTSNSGDVVLSGTSGANAYTVSGGPSVYTVSVTGMNANGNVVATVPAGAAADAAGNTSAASTSTDNTVAFVATIPTTTVINSDLPDPSSVGQTVTVNFTVSASAPTIAGDSPSIVAIPGNVTVTDSLSAATCTATAAAGTCNIVLPNAGARTLTATFGGSGNYLTSSGTAAHLVDGPPSAAATTANVTTPEASSYTFTVTYTDDISLNVTTLDSNDVRVTGPNGFNAAATFVNVNNNTNGTPRTATYSIVPPGGTWDGVDNGAYSVVMQASQVADTFGNFVPAGTVGSFNVTIPTVTISGNIKQFGTNANLANVQVTLTGGSASAADSAPEAPAAVTTTDTNGNYTFSTLTSGGNFVITPAMSGKAFEPVTRTYNNLTVNVTNANFTAYDDPNGIPRNLKLTNSFAIPGQTVTVPVVLTSLGNEAFVSFSVAYNVNVMASSPTASCGSAAPGCAVTFNNSTPGTIGVTVSPSAALTAGQREVARITFQTLPTTVPNTPIAFGNAPATKLVKNAGGDPIPSTFTDGLIVFQQGLEGDLAPRTGGDGQLLPNDVTLERQFVVGTLIPDPTFNEFQRADTAPANTGGDGQLDATDLVKERRYVAGLDNPAAANGPFVAAGSIASPALADVRKDEGRVITVGSVATSNGNRITLPVELTGRGNEVAASFTLDYDPAKLRNPHVELGASGADTVLTVNADKPGKIALLVDSSSPLASHLLTVSFDVSETAASGDTTIAFANDVALGSVSNANGDALGVRYTDGVVSITGPNAAGVTVSGRVLTPDGRGLRNAVVTITDENGESRTATTAAFGGYTFDGVAPGKSYRVSVASRQYRFAARTITVTDTLTNIDLSAIE